MRQFALINSIGETYMLNDLNNFMHEPSGLGFMRNTTFIKLGDRFEVQKDAFEQATPRGQICFKDRKNSPAYEKYAKFVIFLQKTPLKLVYKSDRVHHMDVIPESLEKIEISKPLGLNVSISFRALSMWYDEVEAVGTDQVVIISESIRESPLELIIKGPINAPIWTQQVNGVQIATGKVSSNIPEGSTLHVRTDTNPYQIYEETSGVKTNLYSSSDFSTDRFLYLKNGVNLISCAGASQLKAIGRILYETV
jgi:hypothetical protein